MAHKLWAIRDTVKDMGNLNFNKVNTYLNIQKCTCMYDMYVQRQNMYI